MASLKTDGGVREETGEQGVNSEEMKRFHFVVASTASLSYPRAEGHLSAVLQHVPKSETRPLVHVVPAEDANKQVSY